MNRPVRLLLVVAAATLYVLHNDVWLWNDSRRVLGLPASLAYHVAYCLAAAVLMGLFVGFAWPHEGDDDAVEGPPR
ncbi:MAG: DUF3311 domain-containing protein [Acidobacteriota bacterium]